MGVPAGGSGAAVDDARTLAIRVVDDGVRFKDLREGTIFCQSNDVDDWLVRGPRTASWWARAVSQTANTLMAHHEKFIHHFRLGVGDPAALQHESYSRIMETMLCYDQLDISNLASAELVASATTSRRGQPALRVASTSRPPQRSTRCSWVRRLGTGPPLCRRPSRPGSLRRWLARRRSSKRGGRPDRRGRWPVLSPTLRAKPRPTPTLEYLKVTPGAACGTPLAPLLSLLR